MQISGGGQFWTIQLEYLFSYQQNFYVATYQHGIAEVLYNPNLPDSMIEGQRLMSSQLLTDKKLNM